MNKDALAYFILCRVWNHLIELRDYDAAEVVLKLKFTAIENDIPQEVFALVDNAFRWTTGLDFTEAVKL